MDEHYSRREFFKASGMGLAAVGLGASTLKCAKSSLAIKPNIIYILADDLGYGDLGCYGQKSIQTPNLDRMAAEGIRFTDHYAGSTVCAPSRCSLMTGLHCGHARIRGNARVPLEPGDITIAELLKQAGYATGLVGKWGLGEEGSTGIPTRKGFDYFFGYLNQRHAHNYYTEFLWRNEEKVPLPNDVVKPPHAEANDLAGASTNRAVYSQDLFSQEALQFIENNQAKPFFLYYSVTIPHANNESNILNRHGMEIPDYGIYAEKDWPEPQKGHAAMITRLDHDIGLLLQKLQDLGLDQNTIVFFSSDNGPHREGGNDPDFADSNGPLKGIKRDLYDGGIRVPMIARWPGKIVPGTVSSHVSAFWDVLPTFCELAGVPVPFSSDGTSFLPALLGKNQREHPYLYWEFHERKSTIQALRMGKWKAVRHKPSGSIELYDIEQDVGEETDLAVEHPAVVKKIAAVLQSVRTENAVWPLKDSE